jgi:hypothetical protein
MPEGATGLRLVIYAPHDDATAVRLEQIYGKLD